MRLILRSIALAGLIWVAAPFGMAESGHSVSLSLPAQPLRDALNSLASQTGLQVLYTADEVTAGLTAPKVEGTLTAGEALDELLKGSGLTYEFLNPQTVAVVKEGLGRKPVAQGGERGMGLAQGDGKEKQQGNKGEEAPKLEEIVVSAQKKLERLQDVPVPVTALDAKNLVDTGKLRLSDYFDSVPGLVASDNGGEGYRLVIRGLNGGFQNPTVAVLVDGIPFGATAGGGLGFQIPDFDPSMLERVEVLRGPQGVLWGASAIGGVVNFVTKAPSTDAVSGRLEGDLSSITNGDGPNYGGRGAINVPLSDTLALRVSGYARRDAGYIDNVQSGQSGVNWANAVGGRLATLWRPSENASLQLSALLQDDSKHGANVVFLGPGYGDLQQSFLRGAGWTRTHAQQYSANFNLKMGAVELTSLTDYSSMLLNNLYDYTALNEDFFSTALGYGPTGVSQYSYTKTQNFSEELRLTARLGQAVDWMMGGFYTHQSSPISTPLVVNDLTTGSVTATAISFDWKDRYEETAAFTNFTIHFNPRFDLQVGGRESFIRQYFQETDSGPQTMAFEGVPSPAVYPGEHTSKGVFTYLFTPSFKFSQNLMAYSRIASGYRTGGPNANDVGVLAPEVPPEFRPDKTKNYELGVKGDTFSRKLVFDASLYYIDWKDIQVGLVTPTGLGYTGNAGAAKSEGVELSLEARPFNGTTVGGWVVWNEAIYTEGFQPGTPPPGGQLQETPRWSGNASLQQDFPLTSRVTGFVGGLVTYMGTRRTSPFSSAVPLRTYAKTDLRAGARYDTWTFNLFANNITDKRGLNNFAGVQPTPIDFGIIAPRTIGLSVSKGF